MASALDTIAHLIVPNVLKLKGAAMLIGAMERRDASAFAQVWQQTGVEHTPQVSAKEKGDWRFGVMSLPKPSAMGEAYMCAFVTKKNDGSVNRYFTLEYDYVLATKTEKTILCEREGSLTKKRGDGSPITGDFQADASAFVDAIADKL
ncbi:MAG TPA: hypothetical protein VFV99_21785 [Kofleriaceae bacterium]|nr:hypothetical protein [Kofleriaceae bacterium]